MTNVQIHEVERWASVRLPHATNHLVELASIDSGTLAVNEVAKVQQRLADTFSRLGMSVELQEQVDRGPILIARTRASLSSSGDIALVGHADIVRDLSEEMAPIVIEGDTIRGTGVYDMKGGLVVITEALEALHAMGTLHALPIRVIVNSAEEDPTTEIARAMERNLTGCAAALVFESGRPKDAVVLERKGIIEARVDLQGRSTHAGNALFEGHNALVEASRLVLKLDALKDQERGLTCNPAKLVAGHAANAVPDKASLVFEARYFTGAEYAELMERLKALETPEDPHIQMQFTYNATIPPMERTPATDLLFSEWRTAGDRAGFSLSIFPRVGGASDGNLAAGLGIPTLDALGPRGGGAHEKGEHVILSSLTPKTLNLIYFLCGRLSRTEG
jgi:glutamate carboxypeptidase